MAERNHGCRASLDHSFKGYRLALLENELLRVTVLLDKGADIIEFLHKPTDTDFMWPTPAGLRARGATLPSSAHSEGHFMDHYQGGWQDIFPAAGRGGKFQGVEQGLHGEACLLPWSAQITKDSPQEISVELEVETLRTPFRLKKKLSLKSGVAALFIEETATNLSGETVAAMWGQHPALGGPFLGPDCRIDLKGADIATRRDEVFAAQRLEPGQSGAWPKLRGRNGKAVDLSRLPKAGEKTADLLFLKNLKSNWFAVTNAKTKAGFGLCWDLKAYPYLWLWQVCGGASGYPWWGRTYNLALEPFSSMPDNLEEAVEAGTQLSFKPHESKSAWVTAVAYSGRSKVKSIVRQGKVS